MMIKPTQHSVYPPRLPLIQCAFHSNQYVTNFCHYQQCLLPLCKQCLPIHRKQHSSIPQPMLLSTVDEAVGSIVNQLNTQGQRINQLHKKMIQKFTNINNLHHNIKLQLIHQRDNLVRLIIDSYQSYFIQLNNNFEKNNNWLVEFQKSFQSLKLELHDLYTSLYSQKYLRTIIMWNRQKPSESVTEMFNKMNRDWEKPAINSLDFTAFNQAIFADKNLKMIEIEGDFGVNKLARVFKTVKLGQQGWRSKSIGINLTDERKKNKEIKIAVYSSQVKSSLPTN